MKINITPIFNFLTTYSRKSRLKILGGIYGGIFLCVLLGFLLGLDFLTSHPALFQALGSITVYGILFIPFGLLALIPKQRKEKKGPSVDKVVSTFKKEYTKTQKNMRPATTKERCVLGGILLLASCACFWMGSIAIIGGVFWLVIGLCCFYPRFPIKVQDKKRSFAQPSSKGSKEGKKGEMPILLGVVFTVAGIGCACLLTVGKFTCSKGIVRECEFQEQHLWELDYKTKSILPLEDLKGAFVKTEIKRDKDGTHTMYHVVLKTTYGNKDLFHSSSSSYATHEKRANQINQFLYTDQEKLEIKESKGWLLFPIPFILIGGIFLWKSLTFLMRKSKISPSMKTKKRKDKK